MRIPSYDDLTPSIPDISVRDTFAQVQRILPPDAAALAGRPEPIEPDAPAAQLFACLRSTRVADSPRASDSPELRRATLRLAALAQGRPERSRGASEASRAAAPGGGAPGAVIEVLIAIARDFSPRIERHGPACVVLDVSGLGRLLGDAQAIGAELDRVAADRVAADRAAVQG